MRVFFGIALVCCVLVSGCGQKGPLYLPKGTHSDLPQEPHKAQQ